MIFASAVAYFKWIHTCFHGKLFHFFYCGRWNSNKFPYKKVTTSFIQKDSSISFTFDIFIGKNTTYKLKFLPFNIKPNCVMNCLRQEMNSASFILFVRIWKLRQLIKNSRRLSFFLIVYGVGIQEFYLNDESWWRQVMLLRRKYMQENDFQES